MTVYAVVNTKGGVGKTTTAVHLATMLARTSKTLLIDGDPQASAASWAAWRRDNDRVTSPTTTCLTGKAILSEGKGYWRALRTPSLMPAGVTRPDCALPCFWRTMPSFQSAPPTSMLQPRPTFWKSSKWRGNTTPRSMCVFC